MRLHRLLAYAWASPNTLLGLMPAALAVSTGGRGRVVAGVLEVHGGFATFALRRLTLLPGGAAAMTLGHVVLGTDQQSLDRTRRHERVHVRQYERWGPLFLPTYLAASAVLWLQRRDAYRENFFEREAYSDRPADPS
ncbi:MAG: hypothetical protein ACTHLZ_13625 [Tepidisphaeraceae bacterium]